MCIRDRFNTQLPPANLLPLGLGFIAAIALLVGFALPSLLQLARVPTIRVLRREVGAPPTLVLLAFGPAVAVIALLIYWVVRDVRLFLDFTVGLAGFIALVAGAGWILVHLAGRLRGGVGIAWRYGVANLSRRRAESVLQIVAFGTGIMVLLMLGIVRNHVQDSWRRSLPEDLPNYFFVNIPPDERAPFIEFLKARGAQTSRVLPMIRGRLTAINDRPVEGAQSAGDGENFACLLYTSRCV